mgnify:FL=1
MRNTLRAIAIAAALTGPAVAADLLPASGPLPKVTMERLLIVDAARQGPRVVAVGDRGYIAYTDDNGANWKRAKAPAAPLLTAVDFLDAKTGLAVGHDAIILATADGGETWEKRFSAESEQMPLLDVKFVDRDHAFAVGAYGSYYESADGGRTWNPRKVIADDKHLNAIVALEGGRLVILGEAGTLLVSSDAAKSWSPVPSPYKGSLFGAVVAEDGAVVAFGMRGRIFRSTDKGQSWKAVENASVATLMGGTRLPDGAIVLAGAGGTVLVSRDGGLTFGPLATGSTKAFAKPLLGAPNALMLLGEAGARDVPLPTTKK